MKLCARHVPKSLWVCPSHHRYEMGVAPGVRTWRTYVISLALVTYTTSVSLVSVPAPTSHSMVWMAVEIAGYSV